MLPRGIIGRMDVVYIDESGDDGLAQGASPLFVLCLVSVEAARWAEASLSLGQLRQQLASRHGFPADLEWHARPLLLRKHPYRELGIRAAGVRNLCEQLSALAARGLFRVSIWTFAKGQGSVRPLAALMPSALAEANGRIRIVFSDHGRIGIMRSLALDAKRRGEVDAGLVESIVGLGSAQSDFVQVADIFATAAYLRFAGELAIPRHARMHAEEIDWFVQMVSGPNRTLHLVRA